MKKTYLLFVLAFYFFVHVQGQVSGDFRSKAAGPGNWNDFNAWERYDGTSWVAAISGQLPTSTSSTEIRAGQAMIINATGLASGNLTVNGTLTYISTPASALTVTGSVNVTATGIFTSPTSGTVLTHTLFIGGSTAAGVGGDLVVDGTFNMNVFSTAAVAVTFFGNASNTISGAGPTCKFYSMTINKGATINNILEATRVITIVSPTATGSRLTITNGTLKISSASTLTPYFGALTLSAANSRLWLNNSVASVSNVNAGLATGTGNLTLTNFTIQITAGTFSYGSGSDVATITKTLILDGPTATFNAYGSFKLASTAVVTMSDGSININPQAGNNLTTTDVFGITSSSSATNCQFSGGTITIVDPPVSTSTFTAFITSVSSGTFNMTGTTLRFGDGVSNKAGGANGFLVASTVPFANVIVNNAPASVLATRIVKLNNAFAAGNLTIGSGVANQVLLNGFTLNVNGNLTNSGTLNGDDNAASAIAFNGTGQQVVSGTGTFTNNNFRSLTMNNSSGLSPAVDMQINASVSNALTLTKGILGSTTLSVLTLGKSATSTTFTSIRSGGSLLSLPAFALGGVTTINYTYNAPSPAASITTGFELPAATNLTSFTINNSSGVTLDKAVSATTLALSSGILTATSPNTITVTGASPSNLTGGNAIAYVRGPLTLTIPNNASSANYKFHVGATSYHLIQYASITTGGTGTATFTVQVFDAGPYPGTAGSGLVSVNTDHYWSLTTNLGSVTVASSSISISETGMSGASRVAQSNSDIGPYDNRGGGNIVLSTVTSLFPIDYSASSTGTYFRVGQVSLTPFTAGIYAIGPSGPYAGYADTYTSMQSAVVAITDHSLTGNVIFEFQNDYSPSVEALPQVLSSTLVGTASGTITFRPAPTVSSVINFTNAGVVINNTGADYVIFDGRAGGAGSDRFLQFTSTTIANDPAVNMTNDATHDQFLYCTLKGSQSGTYLGILYLNSPSSGNNFLTVDHCNFNGSGLATNCIIVSALATDCSFTYNNFFDYHGGSGISLSEGGVGAMNTVIDHNNFYQTAPYVGVPFTTDYAIYTHDGSNFQISNNYIGGSGPGATGTWTVSATTPADGYNFYGIYVYIGGTPFNVYNNTIQNFDWKVLSSGSWTGIYAGNSSTVSIGTNGANIIGSPTGNDNIKLTAYAAGNITMTGIYSATNTGNIENNTIGSLTAASNGAINVGSTIYGIQSANNQPVYNNQIGSTVTAQSIRALTTGSTNNIYGVNYSGYTPVITGHTVSNLYNAGPGTNYGIYVNNGSTLNISNNTVYNLLSVGAAGSVVGIYDGNTGTTHLVSGNTVYNLSNTGTGVATVYGIQYNGGNGGANDIIEKNLVHSLVTSSATAVQDGIYLSAGTYLVRNNVVRLGIDITGASVTSTAQINGIIANVPTSGTATPVAVLNNTVYVGGTGVAAGAVKTYAFVLNNHGNNAGFTEDIRDNIFVNVRTNAVANPLNYAISLPAFSLTVPSAYDYNIYQVSPTDGKLSSVGGTDYLNMGGLQGTYPGTNLNSGFGNPLLTNPAAAAGTMSLVPANFTPAEGTGIAIATVTDDFTGLNRSAYTPTDIGAYAGNFTPPTSAQDIWFPVISYTPLSNTSLTTNRTTVSFATATDFSTGINTTGGTKPRLYYKKSTDANAFAGNGPGNNGWKWVEANNSTSPFDFTIDYSIINGGSVALGNIIQYYVVVQDQAPTPNVTFRPALGASGTSVATAGMVAPTTPNSYTIVPLLPNSIDVGTGYTYTTLTGAGGVFSAINAGVINANTVVNIKTDMTEPGTVALNLVSEEGPSAGSLTLTIQSDGAAHLISGTAVATGAPMIPISGASRVIIDGGASKLLTFRNTLAAPANTGPVIQFNNGCVNSTVTRCIIESNSHTTTGNAATTVGQITVGTTGSNSVTISNNDLRNSRGGTLGFAATGIYSNSASNVLTITGNNVYDFQGNNTSYPAYGFYLGTPGNGTTVSGNSFYWDGNIAGNASVGTIIYVLNPGSVTVSGNYIGGSAPNCGGTMWNKSGAAYAYWYGIVVSGATSVPATISNNTIQNFHLTGPQFIGIENLNGISNITGNTLGSTTVANSLQLAMSNTNQYFGYGIYNSGATGPCNFDQNTIANVLFNGGYDYFQAMRTLGGNVRGNKIFNFSGASNEVACIANAGGFAVNEFSNNMISIDGGALNALIYGFDDAALSTGFTSTLLYNSINIYGTATANYNTYAFYRGTSNPFILKDNIFVSQITGGVGSHYVIYAPLGSSFTSDYNDLYASAPPFGYFGNNVTTFAAWQATGQDAHSVNVVPAFVSNSDLHILSDPNIDHKGTPVSVTVDIDGDLRCFPPDLGADQFSTSSVPNVSGNVIACAGTSGNVYTTDAGMTGYSWTISAGGSIDLGSGTNSISVTWNTAGAQYVTVTYTVPGSCPVATPTVFNVAVQAVPDPAGPITGPSSYVPGTTGVAYSVGTINNAITYVWSYTGTGVTINGSGTSVTLDFSLSATDGQLKVKGHSTCGDGTESVLNLMANRTLNLTSVLLEGLYDVSGLMKQAYDGTGPHFTAPTADQINVELHDASSYGTVVYTATGVNLSQTGTATVLVPAIYSGSYFITIRHRNSVETTTAAAVSFAGSTISQSFGAPANVYGGNLGLSGDGYYLIYAGDVTSASGSYPASPSPDGVVDLSDDYYVYSSFLNGDFGYLPGDVNGDGVVDLVDAYMIYSNFLLGIYVMTP